jgi:hypothetical protein
LSNIKLKNNPELVEAIEKVLNSGESIRSAAREVLGSESRESSIRAAIKRGDVVVGESEYVKEETQHVVTPVSLFDIKKDVFTIETVKTVPEDVTHLMIPDTQCKPDIDMSYLDWLGQYIVDKQPEVIIHIGDHADMPSLSSYDKGKGKAEGKRVQKDIEASIEGMNRLLRPLRTLQDLQLAAFGEVEYKPKMVLCLGNHEERIMRHVNDNPELQGFLSYDNLRYADMGWEVYDFLKPVIVNGVSYCHFMANPMSGKPYGGMAMNVLKNVGESFCMGHKQTLDVATRFLPASGRQQWAIIAGAYYEHDEGYKGHQGNHHWRGIVMQHNVKNGSFNPMFVNLEYLKGKYS